MNRLGTATIGGRDEAPPYDRSAEPSIVHLGVGAFARAHLAVYADDLLRAGVPATISGVSLRDPRTEARLVPQDCLYTVTEREPGAAPALRVVGSLTRMATGPDAALNVLAGRAVQMITVTVTEKGYEVPDGDMVDPHHARSAPGVIARALHARRDSGSRGLVVASLDNVLDNGAVLRGAVLAIAERLDAALPQWIEAHAAFPCSVVDRMVPATTDADRTSAAELLGLADDAAVVSERHRSWVVAATAGLPPLASVGVDVVTDVEPYQRRKLWLLNGPHSALAYLGLVAGVTTIAEATRHPGVAGFVHSLVDDVLAVAALPPALAAPRFAAEALVRCANPVLGHTCAQVGADGSRKLVQRLVPVVAARRGAGLPTERFALVAAAWVAAAAGYDVGGRRLPPVADPAAGSSPAELISALGAQVDAAFAAEVRAAVDDLGRHGVGVLG